MARIPPSHGDGRSSTLLRGTIERKRLMELARKLELQKLVHSLKVNLEYLEESDWEETTRDERAAYQDIQELLEYIEYLEGENEEG
jgi:hypothetical protein